MARIGVIGDPHEPVSRAGYLAFCSDTFEKYRCDEIVCIGDMIDWHGISFHTRQPECPGVRDEYQLALKQVKKWHRRFPKLKWCIGNHDERPARLARTVNIPEFMLIPYNEIWGVEEWEYDFDFMIDDTLYRHGTGTGGIHPAWNLMNKSKMSVVIGHCHSRAGVKWSVNPNRRFFAVDVGCGVDDRTFQFAYGQHLPERSVLACAVIDDGQPISIAMPCGRGEKYHDSQFNNRRQKKLKLIGRYKGGSRTAAPGAKTPIHYTVSPRDSGPSPSPLVACNAPGEYTGSRQKTDVTCGNCKRTRIFRGE